jgi:hypothetical protein
MPGDFCHAETAWKTGDVSRPSSPFGLIRVTGDQTIVCPVIKTTSGPSITSGDAITDVDVEVNLSTGTSVDCHLVVYDSNLPTVSTSNALFDYNDSTNVSGYSTLNITTGSSPNVGWWGSSTSWRYAQILCEVTGSSALKPVEIVQYWVTENGSAQSTMIYPPSICAPDPSMTSMWSFSNMRSTSGGTAGFLESEQGTGTDLFKWECGGHTSDSNLQIDISVGKNINYTTTLNAQSGGGSQSIPSGAEFPSVVYSKQFNNVWFGFFINTPGSGDFRLFSFRTR